MRVYLLERFHSYDYEGEDIDEQQVFERLPNAWTTLLEYYAEDLEYQRQEMMDKERTIPFTEKEKIEMIEETSFDDEANKYEVRVGRDYRGARIKEMSVKQ